MSYTIQIIAGAVITLGAVFAVFFRRFKKKAKNALNIEEKKEIEDDIVEIKEDNEKVEK